MVSSGRRLAEDCSYTNLDWLETIFHPVLWDKVELSQRERDLPSVTEKLNSVIKHSYIETKVGQTGLCWHADI